MNYSEWSNEYFDAAKELSDVIEKFKARRKNACRTERTELDAKIAKYREYYYDCIGIANHLMRRHNGDAR